MRIICDYLGEYQIQPEKGEGLTIIPGPNARIELAVKGGHTLYGNFAVVTIGNHEGVRIFCHQSPSADGGPEIIRSAAFQPNYTSDLYLLFRYVAGLTFERALSLCAIFDGSFEFAPHLTAEDMAFIDRCPVADKEEEEPNHD